MAIIRLQWKDPDYCYDLDELFIAFNTKKKPESERKSKWDIFDRDDQQRAWSALHEAGLGEYLVVEFNTETREAKIVKD